MIIGIFLIFCALWIPHEIVFAGDGDAPPTPVVVEDESPNMSVEGDVEPIVTTELEGDSETQALGETIQEADTAIEDPPTDEEDQAIEQNVDSSISGGGLPDDDVESQIDLEIQQNGQNLAKVETPQMEDVGEPTPEIDPTLIPVVPDPYFYFDGVKHSFLPEGGQCSDDPNCHVSATPIQDALDAVAGSLKPDDGMLYIEGGIYDEEIQLNNMDGLILQGSANGQATTLAGIIKIINSQSITLQDFTFLQTIVLDDSTDIIINGTNQNDQMDIELKGSSQVEIQAEEGDDEITIHGSHGDARVDGGSGDDLLVIDFVLDDDPADAMIAYDGGAGFDSMQFQGGRFEAVAYRASGPSSGTIDFDDSHVSYTNIEPITDITLATNVTFPTTLSDEADTIDVLNGGTANGFQTLKVQGDHFEDITFANKQNVTVDGAGGDDTININISYAADELQTLKVSGGGGDDTITILQMIANIDLTIDGGDGDEDSIMVSNNALISTRKITGGDHTDANSTGNSKNIAFTAETITISNGAQVLGHVESGSSFTPGNITLTASDSTVKYTPGIHVADTNAHITVNGATIKGGVVSLDAKADTTRVLPDSASASEWFTNGLLGILQSFSLIGGVVVSNSEAQITIAQNADISATSFSAIALGIAQAWTYPIGIGLGVAVGVLDNTAKVLVNGKITTSGDVYLRAAVDNTVTVVANTHGLAGIAVSAAVSVLDSEATVHVTDDATLIVGGDLMMRAETTDRNYTFAVSATGGNGQVGIAVAVKHEEGLTQAFLDGTAAVDGSITISASQNRQSINVQKLAVIPSNVNGTAAAAGVGTSSTGNLLDDVGSTGFLALVKKVLGNFSTKFQDNSATKGQVQKFEAAGGIALDYDVNRVFARIGDSNLDSDGKSGVVQAKEDISVSASIFDRPDVTASATTSKNENNDDPNAASGKFYGSVSVAIGIYTEDAQAFIASGAQVVAGGSLTVSAVTANDFTFAANTGPLDAGNKIADFKSGVEKNSDGTWKSNPQVIETGKIVEIQSGHPEGKGESGDWYKYIGTRPGTSIDLSQENFANTANWEHLGSPEHYKSKEVIRALTLYLDGNLGLDTYVFDSFSQSTATDADIAVALAVTVIDRTHISKAYIASGARINQDPNNAYRTGSQTVAVTASSIDEMVNAIGNLQLPGVSGSTSKSYFIDVSSFKKAVTEPAGSSAKKSAIGAVILVLDYSNTVIAEIDDGVTLYADSLQVAADNAVMNISVGASGGSSGNFAFNGVVVYQEIDNKTYAQIDNGATIVVGSSPFVYHGGTALGGSKTTIQLGNDASDMDDAYNGRLLQIDDGTGKGQLALITDYDVSRDKTKKVATIVPVAIAPDATTKYSILHITKASTVVEASDDTDVVTLAGSVAVAKGTGVGASVAIHDIERDTQAVTGNLMTETDAAVGSLTLGGPVSIDAANSGFVLAISLAAAIKKKSATVAANDPMDGVSLPTLFGETSAATDQTGKSGAGIAGDVAITTVTDTAKAYIYKTGPINASNQTLTLSASNDTDFIDVAGAVAISLTDPGKKSAGIAGSFGMNTANITTEAFVKDTTVTAGELTLNVRTGGLMVAVTAGGTGQTGTDSYGIAGSVSLNTITHTTTAIVDNVNLTLSGNLTFTAENRSRLVAVGGAFSIGGKVGVGASVVINRINDTTKAEILGSNQTTALNIGGKMTLQANNSSRIIAIAVSAGVSKSAVAGTVAVNLMTTNTQAGIRNAILAIAAGADEITIAAEDSATIYAFAGALGIALKESGLGAALAWNQINSTVRAWVESSTLPAKSLSIQSSVKDAEIWTLSVGAAGAKKTAIAGSVSINVISNTIDAHISGGADIDTAGDVLVIASDESMIKSLAGQAAISLGGNSIGAAVGVNIITNTVKAYIDNSNVDTTASGNIIVQADENATIHSISAGIEGSKGWSLGGSISVNILTNTVKAYLTGSKSINADGSMLVSACNDADTWTLAGNVSISINSTAFGVSNVTLVTNNTVDANIDENMVINASGNGSGVNAYTGLKSGGTKTTQNLKGLIVVAVNFADLDSYAVSGSGGGGVGIAGSATVSVLSDTTLAYIQSGAKINQQNNASSSSDQSVIVRATSDTYLIGVGGGVGLGMKGGIGAGIDVAVVSKTTQAKIEAGAEVDARRDVIVEAISKEEVISISGSVGLGKSIGIAGSVGVSIYTLTTEAYIEGQKTVNNTPLNGAKVTAEGSVKVAAEDDTEIDMIAGSVGISGGQNAIGIAASVSVPIFTKTIKAYIGKGAQVDAFAKHIGGISVKTGKFVETLIPDTLGVIDDPEEGQVPSPSPPGKDQVKNDDYSNKRIVTAGEVTGFKGVAVSAVNQDDLAAWSAGVGISGGKTAAAIQFSTTVNVMTVDTLAYIDDEAQVNQAEGATGDQSVLVVAGNDYSFKGFSGGVAISGGQASAAISPGIFVGIVNITTKAYIGKEAKVNAKSDIVIAADASEELLSLAVALAGGGGQVAAGGAGAVLVFLLDSTTYAYIDQDAIVAAGGNIRIAAGDATEVDTIIGSLAIVGGISGIGVGVSVGVTIIEKDTRAFIAAGAKVTALGNSAANLSPYNGDFDTDWKLLRADGVHGLVVEAYSEEDVWTLVVAGGVAIAKDGLGIGGVVDVIVIDSDTLAYIAASAVINGTNSGAGKLQDVYVTAINEFTLYGIFGGLGASVIGIAGAIDILVQSNDTTAYIAGNVNAMRDIHVNALATRDIETVIVSVGAGGAGIAGSVGVYTLGGNMDSTYSSEGSSDNALNDENENSTATSTDSQLTDITSKATMLSDFNDPNNDPDTQNTNQINSTADTVDTKVKSAVPSDAVSSQVNKDVVNAFRTLPRGTSAFIAENVIVNAGRHVDIDAREHTQFVSKVGGIGAGGIGVGFGVGIVNNNTPVTAFIGSGASISAGLEDTTGAISLDAQLHVDFDLTSFVGTGGGTALGAAVAIINEESDVKAYVVGSPQTQIKQGAALKIKAEKDVIVEALTPNVSIGGISAGAAIAKVDASGDTLAYIGDNSKIGKASGATIGDVSVVADANYDIEVDAWGVSAGMAVGLTANVGLVDITADVQAQIGDSVQIIASGDILVQARAQSNVDVGVWGVAVSTQLAAGVSLAYASVTLDIDATIGQATVIDTSGGDVTVAASHNKNGGKALTDAMASGGGLLAGNGADADTSLNIEVDAAIGNDVEITASGDISLTAEAKHEADSESSSVTVGGAAIAPLYSETDINNYTRVQIGMNAVLNAGKNITLNAKAVHKADSDSDARGGGVIGAMFGDAEVSFDYKTQVNLKTNASLTAGGMLTALAQTSIEGEVTADAIGGGLGSGSEAGATLRVGAPDAVTEVKTDPNISLKGNKVKLIAESPQIKGKVWADARTYGVVGGSNSDAILNITEKTQVTIGINNQITGTESLEIRAEHLALDTDAQSDSVCIAIGGGEALARNNVNTSALVDLPETVTLITRDLQIAARTTLVQYRREVDLDAIGGPEDKEGTLAPKREINLQADIVIFSNPHIIWYQNGSIYRSKYAQLVDYNTSDYDKGFEVGDIELNDNNRGVIKLDVNQITHADLDAAGVAVIKGDKARLQFAFEYVKIEHYYDSVYDGSTLPLTVNNIDVIYRGDQPDVTFETVTLAYDNDDWVTIEDHGFKDGQMLTYLTADTVIAGLTVGKQYYVVQSQEDKFKISQDFSGSPVDLSLTGDSHLQPGHYFMWGTKNAGFTYDPGEDWININSHGFTNGQALVYGTTGDEVDDAISGLEVGKTYYVFDKQDNKFKLSATSTNPVAIDLPFIIQIPTTPAIGHYLSWDADGFTFKYEFKPTDYEETSVEIIKHTTTAHTEESPIRLAGKIVNPYGSTLIQNGLGDILQVEDGTKVQLHTNQLTLEAKLGKIGQNSTPYFINLEMVQFENADGQTVAPILKVEARDEIYLASGTRRYNPDDVDITVAVEQMKSGSTIQLLLNGSSHITRKASGTSWIWESEAGPASAYNFTLIENGGGKDIIINSALLYGPGGSEVWITVRGDMKLSPGGKLWARTTGYIELTEIAGSIVLGAVDSSRGQVHLKAADDIILDATSSFKAGYSSSMYVDYQDTDVTSNKIELNNLEGIDAVIVIYGGGGDDWVYVNDLSDADDEDGALKNTWIDAFNVNLTTLTGLGMSGDASISIDRFAGMIENLDMKLGSGANTLTVRGTTAETWIDMGSGADTLDVGPGAVEAAAGTSGDLTAQNITGMGGLITYNQTSADAENLIISLGAGQDDFTVKTTHSSTHTTVKGGGGNDILTVKNSGSGGQLHIFGGAGMDYIIFQDHGGTTTLNGDNTEDNINDVTPPVCDAETQPCPGDDRFFIQKADGNLTVYGGVGADKYFVASLASRDSFTTNGVYDDTLSTFGALSGDLSGITGKLNIIGNTAGNGGYKDRLYIFAGATAQNGLFAGNTITGMSMSVGGSVQYATVEEIHIKLGAGNDEFAVQNVPAGVATTVYGGNGDDLLEVGNQVNLLADIDGVLTFHGEEGSDTLRAHNEGDSGDCAADVDTDWACGQMTAIGLSGLNMADNNLVEANIFYGILGVDGSLTTSTEAAHVFLGSGADRFFIDSVAGTQLFVHTGDGDDVVRVEATPFGLNPASLRRVDFIAGAAYIYGDAGEDFVIINDSGDDKVNSGQFINGYVTGLGITGSVNFGDTSEKLEIDLGEQNDTFRVYGTPAFLTTTLKMAGGFDDIYVGNAANSLDEILGKLIIEGELPYSNDRLFFYDQGDLDDNAYTISTAIIGSIQIPDPDNPTQTINLPINETTLQRSGSADIIYLTVEQVSLSAGLGADEIFLKSTHLELDPLGGTNSVFAINAGGGDDNIYLEDNDSLEGLDIRVMIDGGDGDDAVHFDHSASQEANTLSFIAKSFAQLFPVQTATWLADFRALLNDNSLNETSAFGSVSMGVVADPTRLVMEMDINVRHAELRVLLGDSDDVFRLSGGTFEMPLRVDAAGGNDTFNISDDVTALETVTLNGDEGDDLVFVDFSSTAPNATISKIIFNGGANGVEGDTLRFAGDGVSSGSYTPSSTVSRAGTVIVSGNTFDFTGLEPLVVHGLAGFFGEHARCAQRSGD